MFGKIILTIGLVAAGLLLVLLNVTTPSTSGAAVILLVFLLAYVVMTMLVTFLLWGVNRVILKLLSEFSRSKRTGVLTVKKAYYYASVIALAPVILVSLQSVGGVGGYEAFLVALFVALGCLYISRRTS